MVACVSLGFIRLRGAANASSAQNYALVTASELALWFGFIWGGLISGLRKSLTLSLVVLLILNAVAAWCFCTLGQVLSNASSTECARLDVRELGDYFFWGGFLLSSASFAAFALHVDAVRKAAWGQDDSRGQRQRVT